MQTTPRYTLTKNEKIKHRKQIEFLFKNAQSFNVYPLRVLYLFAPENDVNVQVGFTVSTRYFKNAVDRNRIKRLMREAYRLQKNDLISKVEKHNKKLQVFFIFSGNELPEYAVVYTKMEQSLSKLIKNLNA